VAIESGTTLAQALKAAQSAPWNLDRLDAQLLLLHVLGRPAHERGWLLAHDTDTLVPEVLATYRELCQRRQSGEPVAYIVGEKEFFGLRLKVNPAVLVPRPDTETLVEWALECGDALEKSRANGTPLKVIDLGTGSGAIALALKSVRPHWHISGLDASAAALAVARSNGQALGLAIAWIQGNWLAPSQSAPPPSDEAHPRPASLGPFDLIVSNPPYIAPNDTHLEALHAEPLSALVALHHGLADLTTIVQQAPRHLNQGGYVLLEHGYDQAEAVQGLLRDSGLQQVTSRSDLAGVWRCTGGVWDSREIPLD
jgi:release factor glutamine methyltransferase